MAKYIIDSSTLTGLADALRKVSGEDRTYTPTEMIEAVIHIMDSATYILVDDDGNEYPAVYVDNETVFTATANDIRIGTVAATADGVTEGTKEIPAYYTTEGYKIIPAGTEFVLKLRKGRYQYTKLQALLCVWDGSWGDSVKTDRVVIENNVYPANSAEPISEISLDSDNESIIFGITNTSENIYVIRYFTYKEEP